MRWMTMAKVWGLVVAVTLCAALFAAVSVTGCAAVSNGDDDDDSSGDDDDDSAGEDVTIYDIQQGEVADGTMVTIKNVVVSTPLSGEDDAAIFVQEPDGGPYSGIFLYLYTEVYASADLAPGDVVNVTGEYTEYFDMSEITVKNPTDLEFVDVTDPPEPEDVDTADIATGADSAEQWESVLIRVKNVTVAEETNNYGEFVIEDGVKVDDLFYQPGNVPAGTEFDAIVGVMNYSFDEFKIEPRDADDLGGYDSGGGEVTIYEIQQGDVTDGATVTLTDVIVTSPMAEADGSFFVQEADGGEYSGIYIYVYGGGEGVSVEPGDVLTLTGTYEEFYDMSEVAVDPEDIEVTDSTDVPDPEVVGVGDVDEPWESVLIRVEDVEVTAEADSHGEWEVEGALIVDDMFYVAEPGVGTVFDSITGPLNYSFEAFKIEPRDAGDLNEH